MATACGCETEDAPVMSFVGQSRGGYIQEMSYKYVGRGQGEFEVVAPRASFNWCFLLAPCLILLGLSLLLLLLWPQTPGTSTTSLLYDCSAANWQTAWSITQQTWCCTNFNKGCTTTTLVATAPFVPVTTVPPLPRTTTPEPYNCNEGGVPTWSEEKRGYCCRVYKNGCPTLYPPPTPPPYVAPYDCAANYANWVAAWSVEQKAWCCKNTGKGCAASGGCATGFPFDCNAGYVNWQVAWSSPQKVWCCQHTGKGCTGAPLPTSY